MKAILKEERYRQTISSVLSVFSKLEIMLNFIAKTISSITGLRAQPNQSFNEESEAQSSVQVEGPSHGYDVSDQELTTAAASSNQLEGLGAPVSMAVTDRHGDAVQLPTPPLAERRFPNRHSLNQYLRNFCRGATGDQPTFVGYAVSKLRSRRGGQYIRYICTRGRPHRNRAAARAGAVASTTVTAQRRRQRKPSLLCGCKFAIDAIRDGDQYRCVVVHAYHNHPPSPSMELYSSLRVPKLDELLAAGLDPAHVLSMQPRTAQAMIRLALNRPEVTAKDFYNLRPRLRRAFENNNNNNNNNN